MNLPDAEGIDPRLVLPGLEDAIACGPQTCRDLDEAIDRVRRQASDQTGASNLIRQRELECVARGLQVTRDYIWQKCRDT